MLTVPMDVAERPAWYDAPVDRWEPSSCIMQQAYNCKQNTVIMMNIYLKNNRLSQYL